jgi:hypothetical protein
MRSGVKRALALNPCYNQNTYPPSFYAGHRETRLSQISSLGVKKCPSKQQNQSCPVPTLSQRHLTHPCPQLFQTHKRTLGQPCTWQFWCQRVPLTLGVGKQSKQQWNVQCTSFLVFSSSLVLSRIDLLVDLGLEGPGFLLSSCWRLLSAQPAYHSISPAAVIRHSVHTSHHLHHIQSKRINSHFTT